MVATPDATGIHFNMSLGNCVLKELQELKIVRERVTLLEESLELSELESLTLREANTRLAEANEALEESLTLQNGLVKDLEGDVKKQKRRSKLGGILAGVAGAGLGVLTGILISQ